jgi:hypothetical protein
MIYCIYIYLVETEIIGILFWIMFPSNVNNLVIHLVVLHIICIFAPALKQYAIASTYVCNYVSIAILNVRSDLGTSLILPTYWKKGSNRSRVQVKNPRV